MKFRRLTATALALVMVLTLWAAPASAVSFSDLTGHWAKADIEYLATQGIIKGYSDNTFKPDAKMSAAEALLFCARATNLDLTTKTALAKDYAAALKKILPESMVSWASEEMAICLATGIISETELSAMCNSGAINKEISRENLCLYLVRAMQLEPLAQSQASYSLSFNDTALISASLQPYVYLLNMYGVIKGNDKNQFDPKGSVTRAAMATMLRRALDVMKEQGVSVELPAYTSYKWVAGNIAAVTAGDKGVTVLTLTSPLDAEPASVSLSADVKVYENNLLSSTTALKAGKYARVNLNGKGIPESVRLGGSLTTYTGSVSTLTEEGITLISGGASRVLSIDRFTQVQVGNDVGDRSLIDLEAGYTDATCMVDELGHLSALRLSGGTREVAGIIDAVNVSVGTMNTISVTGFNGVTEVYNVPTGASIMVNGILGKLNTAYAGDYVNLRISNEDNAVVSAAVDTVTEYIQGSIRGTSYAKYPNTVTVNNFSTGKSVTYNMADGAVVQYEGEKVDFNKVTNGWFVTLRLSGGEVALLDAYPGSTTVEGVLSNITYGTPYTTLEVKQSNGTVISYKVDMSDLPEITRNDRNSSIDKLRSGDTVKLTIRYNRVSAVNATAQEANMSGTIDRITLESGGVTLDLTLSDGSEVTYTVSEGISVTQDGSPISLYALKPNYKVSLVVDGNQVIAIEVDKSADTSNQITGKVLYVNTREGTILLQTSNNSTITIYADDAEIRESSGGSLSLRTLETGDTLQIFGGYTGANFSATIIIRT